MPNAKIEVAVAGILGLAGGYVWKRYANRFIRMVKVYMHYTPSNKNADEWTFVVDASKIIYVHEALTLFLEAYNRKFHASLSLQDLSAVIPPSNNVLRNEKKISQLLLDNTCELYVREKAIPDVRPLLELAQKHKERQEWRSAKPCTWRYIALFMVCLVWEAVLNELDNKNTQAALGLMQLYIQANAFAKAKELGTLFIEKQFDVEINLLLVECDFHLRAYKEALARLEQLRSSKKHQERIENWRAKVLFESGDVKKAIAIVRQRLIDSNEFDLEAIALYSRIAHTRGHELEAMQMILKVLTERSKDKRIQAQFAEYLNAKNGFKHLTQVLDTTTATTAPAYAYLATMAKDHGAIDGCIKCFVQSVNMCPNNASYVLNLVHALEISLEYEKAYQCIVQFCQKNDKKAVGNLICTMVLSILERFPTLLSSKGPLPYELIWTKEGFVQNSHVYQEDMKKKLLEEESWDLLALLFTLVKILFLEGCMTFLPQIITLIEPLRMQYGHHLHQTTIRNEHAYYCCIVQLLCIPEPSLSPISQDDILYVCGDSHTLPTAWRQLEISKSSYRLVPALVTGLKHWHLRPSTNFYPQKNFDNVVQSLPRKARVVFLFGEIDCREGILSVEEGMESTISIFLNKLRQVVAMYEFEAYIHPVVPVLNETRHLVVQYNRIFRKLVERSTFCKWIDCFDEFLDGNEQLQSCFHLDGTHLHPSYISSCLKKGLSQHL
ncbi:hypothetical protein THRCLA_02951 [Thraustotheca clavata]|uniref:Uncharacterized protein n=1 Tax=Thraustotheca clavata TaxID=74557 RepID=A0A1W0A3I3_9STRA|nr:hypothetical protein THRCLA_02951 [Thraustotheca clavata]